MRCLLEWSVGLFATTGAPTLLRMLRGPPLLRKLTMRRSRKSHWHEITNRNRDWACRYDCICSHSTINSLRNQKCHGSSCRASGTSHFDQARSESRADVLLKLQGYFPFREELFIQDGVVFKGERIIVPSTLRQSTIDKVHASHLGVQGCLRRAKKAFYWSGIYKQITEFI